MKFVEPDKINYETFWRSINYSYIIWYNIQTLWGTGARHDSIKSYPGTHKFPESLVITYLVNSS